MIIQRSKLIFLHIPKTGGTSIERHLIPEILSPNIFNQKYMFGLIDRQYAQHFNYENMQKHSEEKLDDYFKFTFVRNTWDRLVSAYNYLYKNKDFNSFVQGKCLSLQKGILTQTDHFNTQMVFIKDKYDNVVPNFIGRFERLQEDYNRLMQQLNGSTRSMWGYQLPKINESKKDNRHYTEYYTDYTKDLVAETYSKEIEYFNFEFQKPQ